MTWHGCLSVSDNSAALIPPKMSLHGDAQPKAMWELIRSTFTRFCTTRGSRFVSRAELAYLLKRLEPSWKDEALDQLISARAHDDDQVDCLAFVDWLFSSSAGTLHGSCTAPGRAMLEQASPPKAWVNHTAGKITYVTDVEGHWEYFCSFVQASEGVYFVDKRIDPFGATSTLELGLQDGWHFVFGGDCCDKGPGSLRFVGALVALKKKTPGPSTLDHGEPRCQQNAIHC